ncbi:EAL domain-containing protein [Magnetococcus sp. PR-3]|uniref:EAL domain-containing protein n=1 Tax=Magnetococcus sp. PR-3 TaxID=3120355 RepID=UPI002FCE0F7E
MLRLLLIVVLPLVLAVTLFVTQTGLWSSMQQATPGQAHHAQDAEPLLKQAYAQAYAWQQLLVEGLMVEKFETYLAKFHKHRRVTREGLQRMVTRLEGDPALARWQALLQAHMAMDPAFRQALERFQVVQENPKEAAVAVMPDLENRFLNPLEHAVGQLQQQRSQALQQQEQGHRGLTPLLLWGMGSALVMWMLQLGLLYRWQQHPLKQMAQLLKNIWPDTVPQPDLPIEKAPALWLEQALLALTRPRSLPTPKDDPAPVCTDPLRLELGPLRHAHGEGDIHGLVVVRLLDSEQMGLQIGMKPWVEWLTNAMARLHQSLGAEASAMMLGMQGIAVRLPAVPEPLALAGWVSQITTALQGLPQTLSLPLPLSVSVGVGLKADRDLQQALQQAWLASYLPQRSGYGCYEQALAAQSMTEPWYSLCEAVQARRGMALFTPIVSLQAGGVSYVEMSMHWQHEEGGVMTLPTQPVAWYLQLQLPGVAWWMMEQAVHQLHAWRQEALNIQLDLQRWPLPDVTFVGRLQTLMMRLQVPEARLTILIHHDQWRDPHQQQSIQAFQRLGIQWGVKGVGGITHWQGWPSSCLICLDELWIKRLEGDEEACAELQALSILTAEHEMTMMASAVESRMTLELSKKMGCDAFQGAFIAPAMAADDFLTWRNRSPWCR